MYLQLAGLLKSPKRAHFQITPRGADVLQSPPSRIDLKFLEQYPEFVAFRNPRVVPPVPDTQPLEDEPESPEEALETAHLKMRAGLASELLSRVKAAPPKFFEQLVVQLLINMDYGGSRKDAGQAIGHVGDDGIISEDRLGLDIVYLQAKRWEGTVGRPDIQKFVGALEASKEGGFHHNRYVLLGSD